MQRVCKLLNVTPIWAEVSDLYEPADERLQENNYRVDLKLRKLK
jgi:hypothetical protein